MVDIQLVFVFTCLFFHFSKIEMRYLGVVRDRDINQLITWATFKHTKNEIRRTMGRGIAGAGVESRRDLFQLEEEAERANKGQFKHPQWGVFWELPPGRQWRSNRIVTEEDWGYTEDKLFLILYRSPTPTAASHLPNFSDSQNCTLGYTALTSFENKTQILFW